VFVEDVVDKMRVHSTIAFFNLDVLHSPRIIDDAFETRKLLATAISRQFFGCFATQLAWSDYWACCGPAGLLSAVYVRNTFGLNYYLETIRSQMKEVIAFEKSHGGIRLQCIDDMDDVSDVHVRAAVSRWTMGRTMVDFSCSAYS
jgi:transcription initiation factor TFIID subunit 2